MTTYNIIEAQNANSVRKGNKVECKSLTSAKRTASRMQAFHGTTLIIESDNGAVLTVKENGFWQDQI